MVRLSALVFFLLFISSCRYDHLPDPVKSSCDSTFVTYHGTVLPILQQHCYSCHSGAVLSGGVDLGVYANVKFYADEGSLWSVTCRDGNFPPMPPDVSARLDSCELGKLKKWIREGAQNN